MVDTFTGRLFAALPEHMRDADTAQATPFIAGNLDMTNLDGGAPAGELGGPADGGGMGDVVGDTFDGGTPTDGGTPVGPDVPAKAGPLVRYLSLLGDLAGAVEGIAGRAEAGELTSAALADDAWLPWFGQLLGVHTPPGTSAAVQRVAVTGGTGGWQAGTRQSLADAARRSLTGSRYVAVRDHDGAPAGDPWTILLIIREDEAPTPLSLVADAISAVGAKPAGFKLRVLAFTPKWSDIDGAYLTWDSIDTKTRWWDVDATGS